MTPALVQLETLGDGGIFEWSWWCCYRLSSRCSSVSQYGIKMYNGALHSIKTLELQDTVVLFTPLATRWSPCINCQIVLHVLKICASLFWFLSPHLTFAFTSKSYLTFPHLFILISGNSTTSVSRRVSRAEAAAWLVFPQSCQIDITEHLVHSRRHNHFLHPLLLTALCNNPSQILQSSLYVQQWQGCLFSNTMHIHIELIAEFRNVWRCFSEWRP